MEVLGEIVVILTGIINIVLGTLKIRDTLNDRKRHKNDDTGSPSQE